MKLDIGFLGENYVGADYNVKVIALYNKNLDKICSFTSQNEYQYFEEKVEVDTRYVI